MGFIYLISDWGSNPPKYKIGITKNDVDKRLKSLQTGSSNELVLIKTYQSENYKSIEGTLHRKYQTQSTDGGKEWFYLNDDNVINFINDCEKIDNNITLLKENNNFII